MMIERVDNIFPNIVRMHWMNITVGNHFSTILTKLYYCNFISTHISKNVKYTIIGIILLRGF